MTTALSGQQMTLSVGVYSCSFSAILHGSLLGVAGQKAKPTVEISDRARLNLEKFFWSSREK
jgi:hypothetical protein